MSAVNIAHNIVDFSAQLIILILQPLLYFPKFHVFLSFIVQLIIQLLNYTFKL